MAKPTSILITCEHGGNRVPPRYRPLFRGHEALLTTHRGFDAGALVMAMELAAAFNAPLFVSTVSRLLIDLNRSLGHPRLYSDATRSAPDDVRHEILRTHYLPYRDAVEAHIAGEIAEGHRVIHISSHSFTPVLDGEMRNADIGLLYDPARPGEVELCRRWQLALKALDRNLRVRRNYPYTGTSDGFTAWLRRHFAPADYVGIELEVNQAVVSSGGATWRKARRQLLAALQSALVKA